jgi:hypothetical protein
MFDGVISAKPTAILYRTALITSSLFQNRRTIVLYSFVFHAQVIRYVIHRFVFRKLPSQFQVLNTKVASAAESNGIAGAERNRPRPWSVSSKSSNAVADFPRAMRRLWRSGDISSTDG